VKDYYYSFPTFSSVFKIIKLILNPPLREKSYMTETIERLTNEKIQEQYFKRVKAFFAQVKEWLPNELDMPYPIPERNRTITDITGTYRVGMASIYKKCVPEPDNFVADIFPWGQLPYWVKGF
jgi:hypothetical protein